MYAVLQGIKCMTLRRPSNDDVVSTPSEPPALAIVNAFVNSNK